MSRKMEPEGGGAPFRGEERRCSELVAGFDVLDDALDASLHLLASAATSPEKGTTWARSHASA